MKSIEEKNKYFIIITFSFFGIGYWITSVNIKEENPINNFKGLIYHIGLPFIIIIWTKHKDITIS